MLPPDCCTKLCQESKIIQESTFRKCSKCKQDKPLGSFSKSQSYCKICMRAYNSALYTPVVYPAKPCAFCGSEFDSKYDYAKFCSRQCRSSAHNAAKSAALQADKAANPRLCEFCNEDITGRRSDVRYCRKLCSSRARATRTPPEKRRQWRLSTVYGITPEDYDAMVIKQNDSCAVCVATDPGTPHGFWHIDHCHDTGIIRGLLCSTCNLGLGSFYDNPEVLMRAAGYVRAAGKGWTN